MLRKPVVAGRFYPASKDHLEKDIKRYLSTGAKMRSAIGLIAPHAGYMYSGAVAGAVFSSVNVPEKVIVLSPNHTGRGAAAAVRAKGEWATPLGNVSVDEDLCGALLSACPELKDDAVAHEDEHSLEVELPFLKVLQPKLSIVPITLSHLRFDVCEKIGRAIANVIRRIQTPPFEKGGVGGILIVASSDMTHYEPHEVAKEKDKRAIERVLSLDAKGLLDTCAKERITMCGVVPAAVMLIAAKELGAKKGELVKYATSGEVSGDYDAVVGYAGVVIA